MANAWYKDPQATLDWLFDWSTWLLPGESIITASFVASPGIVISTTSIALTSATVWLTGGTVGRPYKITNAITTDYGRTENQSITVRVAQR